MPPLARLPASEVGISWKIPSIGHRLSRNTGSLKEAPDEHDEHDEHHDQHHDQHHDMQSQHTLRHPHHD